MSAVVVEIGANAAQFEKVVAGLPQRIERSAAGMTQGLKTAGKQGSVSMGQLAMQIQDVAVQLQMGTKAAVVFTQQGAQVLSAFGKSGAVAGGILAIGGALISMGDAAEKAFASAKTLAEEFNKSMREVVQFGSVDALGNAVEQATKRMRDEYARVMAAQEGASGLSGWVAHQFSTGPDPAAVIEQANKAALDAGAALLSLEQALVAASEREANIAEMRAAGKTAEADAMERQLKLAKEISKVRSMGLSPAAESAVVSNLRRADAAQTPAAPSWFSTMMSSISASFTRTIPDLAKAMSEAMTTRVAALRESARSLGAAAFGPLKGDADISTGRGSSVNPLTGSASRQISLMLRQAALMESQAKSLSQSNTLLAAIEQGVRKMAPTYN